MTVSVETLGGEQPCTCMPLLGWRGKEGSPGGTGVWSDTIRFQNEPPTVYSDLKYTVKRS